MKRRTAVISSIAAGALVLGGTAAFADIVGPDNTITSCVVNKTGALRIVGPDKPCAKTETKLVWNQQGVPGAPGADGDNGTDGKNGLDGAPGVSGLETVVSEIRSVDADGIGTVDALCPPGKKAVGGGWELTSASGNGARLEDFQPWGDVPIDNNNAWRVTAKNLDLDHDETGSVQFRAYAICAIVGPD